MHDRCFHGREGDEVLNIQHFLQPLQSFCRVLLRGRIDQRLEIGSIRFGIPRQDFQLLVHIAVAGAAIVEITFGRRAKVSLDERFICTLHQHANAQIPAIQVHQRGRGAWREHPQLIEQPAGQLLAQPRRVLHRIVQMNLAQAVKAASGDKLVKVQRQRRLGVYWFKCE